MFNYGPVIYFHIFFEVLPVYFDLRPFYGYIKPLELLKVTLFVVVLFKLYGRFIFYINITIVSCVCLLKDLVCI